MSFKSFKAFAEKAITRCGATFNIKSVQKNFDGEVTAVKGYVILINEQQQPTEQEMLWNLKGQAMLIGEQFDLVKEMSFDEVEDDAKTLLEAKA
jgi:hypothetical protein